MTLLKDDLLWFRGLQETDGPFTARLVKFESAAMKCDFCCNFVKEHYCLNPVTDNTKRIRACHVCAGEIFEDKLDEMTQHLQAGLSDVKPGNKAAASIMLEDDARRKRDAKELVVTLSDNVKKAAAFWDMGLCKTWKLIPDLIRAYKRYGKLSLKQAAALIKYVNSCQSKIEKE